ncbi:sodium-independent sulfate anion transporter isoform X2 [Condylostylus longicornis]|nr:sodium-independent sulfate anion transporter isoform X2 [Condylostylus longicornis]
MSDCEELTPNKKKSPHIIGLGVNCNAGDSSDSGESRILEKPPKKSVFKRRINILNWIGKYDKNIAISDLIAGLTLGLTIIPQSIAYASLAGLPSQYGLYAAFMGAFVYVIVGTVKEVSIGPTSLMALLTLQYTYNKPPQFAVILAFLSGIVELVMGLLNIGFIVDFISDPVTSAFTSATALIVIVSQAKNLLGIRIPAKDIADTIIQLFAQIQETRLGDSLLGLACIVFLLSLRQLNLLNINKSRRVLKKFLWYISISRNAICVVAASGVAFYLTQIYENENLPIKLSGNVESGVPSFSLPPYTIEHDGVTYNFLDILRELGSGIIIVPLVGMLANVAIAKAFAADGNLDASQEMFALGLCNIAGSFFRGIPTCGAFTRSAVSNASGVRTPMAGIYSGVLVLLALSLFTPFFKYIPKTTLAAVLICAVVFMMDLKIALRLYKKSKKDFIGWLCCFVISLAFGVEIGLLSGIVISIIFLLMKLARPKIVIHIKEIDKVEYIHIRPSSEIFYTAIDYLRLKVNKACLASKYRYPVVVDCDKISQLDYTSIKTINLLAKELNAHDVTLIIHNMRNKLQKYLDDSQNIKFCSGKLTTALFSRKSISNESSDRSCV